MSTFLQPPAIVSQAEGGFEFFGSQAIYELGDRIDP
jgi:hypothetical protein